ncbi:LPS export ABC transporter permease LptG [Zooshikella sp. RANM57]|uniref:LPS export ABC transporter permease LptG n=1 Tax=Zooshikella sp. RANM57 TaxID=3425863 RepID=UPI003D6E6748
MRRLDRYIGRHVLGAVLVVLLIIVALDTLFGFVAQLESMRANYQMAEVLEYTLLTIPKRIYQFIPFSAMIGCLVGLGALASNSELVVMRAAGVSLTRILVAVLKPTLLIICVGLAIGEYVAPLTEQLADSGRAVARSGDGEQSFTQQGLWHREGNEFMRFNAVEPNGKLHGVTRMKFNKQRELLESSFAEQAIYQGDHWVLQNLTLNKFENDQVTTVTVPRLEWNTSLSRELLNVVVVKPDDLAIQGLYTYVAYLKAQGLNAGEYELAFWRKVMQPLAVIALVLIGISFIFGPLRTVTMGLRVFTGVVVGLVFSILQDLLGPSSLVFGFHPLLAILAPIIICILVGGILLRRAG